MSPIEEAKKPFNTQSQSLANWLKQQKSDAAPAQPSQPKNVSNKSAASSASDGSLKISSSGHFKLAPLKRDNSASPKPTQSPLFGSPAQGVWRRIASPKKEETVLAPTPEPEHKPNERKGSMNDLPEEELVKLGIHLAQRHRQPSADGFNWAEDDDIEDWADDMPEAATEVEEPAEDLPKVATGTRPAQAWKPISSTNYVPIDQQLKEYEEKRAAQAQQPQGSGRSLFDDKWRGGDRYGNDRYGGDRYGGDRYGNDRYGGDRYGGDRYGSDRYGGGDRFERRGRLSPERSPFGAMRYDSYDRFSNDYHPRRELYNDQSGRVEMESGDARNYKPSGARRSPQMTRAEMASPRSTHVTPASPRGSSAVASPASSNATAASPAASSPAPAPAPAQPVMDAATLLAQQEETMRQAREKAKLRKEEEQRVEEERRKAARKRAEELAKKAEARAKEKELEQQQQQQPPRKEVPTGPSADRAKHTPTNDASSTNNNGSVGSSTSPAAIWAPKRFAGKSATSTWSPLSYDKPRLLDDPQSPELRNGRGTSRFFPSPKSEIGSGSPWRDASSPTRQGQGRDMPAGLSLEPNGDREIGGLAARALGDVKNLPSANGRRGQAAANPNSLSGFGLAMPADVPISRIPPDTEFISKSKDNKKNKVLENGKGDKDLRKSPVGGSVQPPTQPQALSAAQARQQKRSAKIARLDHKQLFYSYEMEIGREDAIERELRSAPGDLVQIAPVSVGMYTTKGSSFKPLPEVRSVIVGSYSYSISSKLKRAVREPISIIKHADMNFSLKLPA
ncbi:hypothetical protein CJU89_3450 [Yarrowia sp. B02]|nr:hypothetical protein CJU89_3450 [Yarrowia sp. B02]